MLSFLFLSGMTIEFCDAKFGRVMFFLSVTKTKKRKQKTESFIERVNERENKDIHFAHILLRSTNLTLQLEGRTLHKPKMKRI